MHVMSWSLSIEDNDGFGLFGEPLPFREPRVTLDASFLLTQAEADAFARWVSERGGRVPGTMCLPEKTRALVGQGDAPQLPAPSEVIDAEFVE